MNEVEPSTAGATSSSDHGKRAIIAYDIPVRPGMFVNLRLPRDLNKKEAQRICDVIQAVAFDE